MKDQWSEAILHRFEGREVLSQEELYRLFFQTIGLSKDDVFGCFSEIESNYSIPVGVLRPDDKLSTLTEATPTTNPIKWFFWRSRSEFREAELLDELKSRLRKSGNLDEWHVIETVQDFVLAWCGKKNETRL